jgi:sugar phosphate isomerase/epimerase
MARQSVVFTRRQALAALAAPAAAAARYRPLLSAQIYVWTQQFNQQKKPMAEGIGEALAAVRRAGYRRIELMSLCYRPEVRGHTLAAMKQTGVEVPVVYHGGPMHEEQAAQKTVAEAIELADIVKVSGTRFITLNPNPKPKRERKTDEELRVQARYVEQLSGELKKRGLGLMLHHHDPEMAENAREWRHLLQNTGPLVQQCLDLHWIFRGGQDYLALLRESGEKLGGLHLRNSKQNVWTEALGEGDLDYAKVAAYLREIGFSGYLMVELAHEKATEVTRSLEENLRLSRLFAEKVFRPVG